MKTSAILALALLPGMAAADEFSGAVGLAFGRTNAEGMAIDTTNLNARVDFVSQTGFALRGRVDQISGSSLDEDDTATGTFAGASLGYRIGGGIGAGGYVETVDVTADGFGDLGDLTSYGLTLGLQNGGLNVDGFYGQSQASDQEEGLTISDYGVFASYEAVPGLALGGNFVTTQLSYEGETADMTAIGAAAAYSVTEAVTVFGGVTRTRIDDLDLSLTSTGVGLGIDMAQVTRFASVVSVEYAVNTGTLDGESGDSDTLRVGLTVPFGAKAAGVPDGSVAGAVLRPTHNALSSLVMGAF